jgi:hypothetical protein
MPDWNEIVRKNLRVLRACSPEFTEELAAHLEDSYEALLREGVAAETAFQRTMRQIEGRRRDWLEIHFLKEELMTGLTRMNGFIRKVALPALLSTAASALVSWALIRVGIWPKVILMPNREFQMFLALSPWWWGMLPICGALGAMLSRRNGGTRLQRIAAATAPGTVIAAIFLLLFPLDFIPQCLRNPGEALTMLEGVGLMLLSFAVIPAVFLLLGAGVAEVSAKKFDRLAQ